MTVSVPVQGYANSPTISSGDNLKLIIIGVVVVTVVIALAIIIKK